MAAWSRMQGYPEFETHWFWFYPVDPGSNPTVSGSLTKGLFIIKKLRMRKSSHGGLEVERLLHKLHASTLVGSNPARRQKDFRVTGLG